MKPSECMDMINYIEENFPVQKWVRHGFHIWPIIRARLSIELQTEKSNEDNFSDVRKDNKGISFLKRISESVNGVSKYAYGYIRDYRKNDTLNHVADIVFYTQSIRRISVNYEWYDRFCDPLVGLLAKYNLKSLMLECTPQYQYQIPRFSKSIFIQPYLGYANIKAKFQASGQLKKLEGYDNFIAFLASKNIDSQSLRITQHVNSIRSMANMFKKMLYKAKPSLGFVVCYAGIDGMAFTLACRELGIPSVDIQHGYQGELNYAYGRWHRVPEEGYELLPRFFWCWGSEEYDVIRQWTDKCSQWHSAIVGGNLWLELWKNTDNTLVADYDIQIRKLVGNSEEKGILVTLQNGYECPDFLLQAIKMAPANWKWWIRLHPIMLGDRERIRKMFAEYGNNIEIDFSTELPLLAWLQHVDVHMTRSSATVLEAAAFGVPSVLLDPMGVELYPEQIESGVAVAAYSASEVVSAAKKQMHNRRIEPRKDEYNRTDQGDQTIQFLLSYGKLALL